MLSLFFRAGFYSVRKQKVNDLAGFPQRPLGVPDEEDFHPSGIAYENFESVLGGPGNRLLGLEKNLELRLVVRLNAHPGLIDGLNFEDVPILYLFQSFARKSSRGRESFQFLFWLGRPGSL